MALVLLTGVTGVVEAVSFKRWLTYAVCGEGAMIMVAALLALGLPGDPSQQTPHRVAVIVVLAATMGSRNVTILRVAAHDLTTTVLTRALAGAFLLSWHPAVALAVAALLEIIAGLLCLCTKPCSRLLAATRPWPPADSPVELSTASSGPAPCKPVIRTPVP
jgi:hypothetical protein